MISLIQLTPLGPFFFGGERTFHYPGVNETGNSYFVRSLDRPAQTALLGALRYLGNRNKGQAGAGYARDDEAIGPESFALGKPGQQFGWIKAISPLHLRGSGGEVLVPVPLDHQAGQDQYSPLSWDPDPVEVADGCAVRPRILPAGFSGKMGLAEGWLNLASGRVEGDQPGPNSAPRPVDRPVMRLELSLDAPAPAPADGSSEATKLFRKRESRLLRHDLSFAFFADLDDQFAPAPDFVWMGQGGRPFKVAITRHAARQKAQLHDAVQRVITAPPRHLPPGLGFGYALSDVYADPARVAGACDFVIGAAAKLRPLATRYGQTDQPGRFRRGRHLLRLLKAGSVFLIRHPQGFQDAISDPSAQVAGFNQVVIKEGL
ncbi:MAG: hypothetical protein LBD51_03145 [Bifidobacteriaceae bacterium]|jgi:hypothetical protein|nr:hypothetical protein [Bifidobacteriaceae bacterium]